MARSERTEYQGQNSSLYQIVGRAIFVLGNYPSATSNNFGCSVYCLMKPSSTGIRVAGGYLPKLIIKGED